MGNLKTNSAHPDCDFREPGRAARFLLSSVPFLPTKSETTGGAKALVFVAISAKFAVYHGASHSVAVFAQVDGQNVQINLGATQVAVTKESLDLADVCAGAHQPQRCRMSEAVRMQPGQPIADAETLNAVVDAAGVEDFAASVGKKDAVASLGPRFKDRHCRQSDRHNSVLRALALIDAGRPLHEIEVLAADVANLGTAQAEIQPQVQDDVVTFGGEPTRAAHTFLLADTNSQEIHGVRPAKRDRQHLAFRASASWFWCWELQDVRRFGDFAFIGHGQGLQNTCGKRPKLLPVNRNPAATPAADTSFAPPGLRASCANVQGAIANYLVPATNHGASGHLPADARVLAGLKSALAPRITVPAAGMDPLVKTAMTSPEVAESPSPNECAGLARPVTAASLLQRPDVTERCSRLLQGQPDTQAPARNRVQITALGRNECVCAGRAPGRLFGRRRAVVWARAEGDYLDNEIDRMVSQRARSF